MKFLTQVRGRDITQLVLKQVSLHSLHQLQKLFALLTIHYRLNYKIKPLAECRKGFRHFAQNKCSAGRGLAPRSEFYIKLHYTIFLTDLSSGRLHNLFPGTLCNLPIAIRVPMCYTIKCQGERERTPNRLRIVRVATNSLKKM